MTAPVAIVTGAARGLGAAMADLFEERGWAVAVLDLDTTGAVPSPRRAVVRCDVTDGDACRDVVDGIGGRFGRIDAVVNNAGIAVPAASHLVSDAHWTALMSVHAGGTLHVTTAALPWLVRAAAPAVVNISSVSAARGFPARLAYGAAKAAVESMTRTYAAEWGRAGVRVNAVSPGFILTDLARSLYDSGAADPSARAERTSLGRLGEPGEIAEAVYWLASPASSYVTGQVLTVDGGFLTDGRTGADKHQPTKDELTALGAAEQEATICP